MERVDLIPFQARHLDLVAPWFDHPEVQSRLGGRAWIRRELELMKSQPGQEYRGATVTGRNDWVAFVDDTAVGFIGVETYDR